MSEQSSEGAVVAPKRHMLDHKHTSRRASESAESAAWQRVACAQLGWSELGCTVRPVPTRDIHKRPHTQPTVQTLTSKATDQPAVRREQPEVRAAPWLGPPTARA